MPWWQWVRGGRSDGMGPRPRAETAVGQGRDQRLAVGSQSWAVTVEVVSQQPWHGCSRGAAKVKLLMSHMVIFLFVKLEIKKQSLVFLPGACGAACVLRPCHPPHTSSVLEPWPATAHGPVSISHGPVSIYPLDAQVAWTRFVSHLISLPPSPLAHIRADARMHVLMKRIPCRGMVVRQAL
jgi:hypothetical protein